MHVLGVCIRVCYIRVRICIVYAWGVCMSMCIYMCSACMFYGCTFVWVHVFDYAVQRFGPVWRDPDPLRKVRIYARYGPDTMAIRRPTHEMIRRFLPVRVMKTRRRFGFKTASFHMSICLLVYFNFSVLFYCFIRMYILFCIIFFMSATIVISWCSHVILWIYCYSIASIVILLFWYSKLASISHNSPY